MSEGSHIHSEEVYDMCLALWEHPRRVTPGETVYYAVDERHEPFEVTQVRAFTDYHYVQLYYRGNTGFMTPFKFWLERDRVVTEELLLLKEFYTEMRANPDTEYTIKDLPDCAKIYFITE